MNTQNDPVLSDLRKRIAPSTTRYEMFAASLVADIESGRRIRVKTQFTEGATGVEQGTTVKKRTSRSKSVEEVEAPIEAIDLIDVV